MSNYNFTVTLNGLNNINAKVGDYTKSDTSPCRPPKKKCDKKKVAFHHIPKATCRQMAI